MAITWATFEATISRFSLVIDLNDNSANFEATTSRLFRVIYLNDTYRMMITMMVMMMKTQNGNNGANFETTTSRF